MIHSEAAGGAARRGADPIVTPGPSCSTKDGSVLAERQVPPPAWDGLAIANERLFLSTQTGELLCLGGK